MFKILTINGLYVVGKFSDLLEVLEDLSHHYATVKDLLDDQLESH